jgi:UDP-N-acetylglucosamine--N-acetylmuramyl-(pentapeptide) pyrophosphoryl-undecaprenol N-acetylglucosamine transferase
LSTGGTGGHIFPALAVGQALLTHTEGQIDVKFVGARGGMEERLVPQHGFPLTTLPISGIYRQLTLRNLWRNLQFPLNYLHSSRLARRLMATEQPVAVVGFGGYASWPVLRQAIGKPGVFTAIQEQNAFPGLVNRQLGPRVDTVFLGDAAAAPWFKGRQTVVSGNPIRAEITTPVAEPHRVFGLDPTRKTVLVTGGSLGARGINEPVAQLVRRFQAEGVQFIWQTGRFYIEALKHEFGTLGGLWLQPFIDHMAAAYQAADVVICRAGALTLAELKAVHRPAILIPSPNVAENHQHANAEAFVRLGGGWLVPESQSLSQLPETLAQALNDPAALKAKQLALKQLPQTAAAELIAGHILRQTGLHPVATTTPHHP